MNILKQKMTPMILMGLLITTTLHADITAFGFTLNQSTEKDLKNVKCKFTKQKTSEKRISTFATNGTCYKIPGLKKVLVTFVDKKVKFIDGIFNKDEFSTIKDSLDNKYGEPSSSEIPFVGDSYAEWEPANENGLIRLDAPHLSFEMQLFYIDSDYLNEIQTNSQNKNNQNSKQRNSVL